MQPDQILAYPFHSTPSSPLGRRELQTRACLEIYILIPATLRMRKSGENEYNREIMKPIFRSRFERGDRPSIAQSRNDDYHETIQRTGVLIPTPRHLRALKIQYPLLQTVCDIFPKVSGC